MNVIKSRFVYHLMAIITVAIWGTTFVSTKILIQHGLSPSDIFFYRFTLAYLCMWCISYKKLFANRVKDELLLLLAGSVKISSEVPTCTTSPSLIMAMRSPSLIAQWNECPHNRGLPDRYGHPDRSCLRFPDSFRIVSYNRPV